MRAKRFYDDKENDGDEDEKSRFLKRARMIPSSLASAYAASAAVVASTATAAASTARAALQTTGSMFVPNRLINPDFKFGRDIQTNIKQMLGTDVNQKIEPCARATNFGTSCASSLIYQSKEDVNETLNCTNYCASTCDQWVDRLLNPPQGVIVRASQTGSSTPHYLHKRVHEVKLAILVKDQFVDQNLSVIINNWHNKRSYRVFKGDYRSTNAIPLPELSAKICTLLSGNKIAKMSISIYFDHFRVPGNDTESSEDLPHLVRFTKDACASGDNCRISYADGLRTPAPAEQKIFRPVRAWSRIRWEARAVRKGWSVVAHDMYQVSSLTVRFDS